MKQDADDWQGRCEDISAYVRVRADELESLARLAAERGEADIAAELRTIKHGLLMEVGS